MSKFKVGDLVKCVQPKSDVDSALNLDVDTIYTVTDAWSGSVGLEGHIRTFSASRFELYVEPATTSVCPCTTSSDEEESFFFSYTYETDSGTDTATASLNGDKAGDITHVLDVFRAFLQRSGFNWVAEVNVTAEDGTWHSSNSAA